MNIITGILLLDSLDGISAFPFENHLKSIKRLVRQPNRPLEQIVRRLNEKQRSVTNDHHQNHSVSASKQKSSGSNLLYPHANGPLPPNITARDVQQYERISVDYGLLSTKSCDSCFITTGGEVGIVRNIIRQTQGYISVVCEIFVHKKDFFAYPLKSGKLNIFKVNSDIRQPRILALQDICGKCLLIKMSDSVSSVVIPMLHNP